MNPRVSYDCRGIDWTTVASLLETVGMAHFAPEVHKRAFEASHTTVFLFDGDRLIGFGRAISDGAYQAAIYDCAISPDYQGNHLGSTLMDRIMERLEGCSVILYAAPGKEGFYAKQGFSRMKTGMARFVNRDIMREKGFTE